MVCSIETGFGFGKLQREFHQGWESHLCYKFSVALLQLVCGVVMRVLPRGGKPVGLQGR